MFQVFSVMLTFFTSPHPQALFPLYAAAKSLQSCLTLCNPIEGSPPGSPIPGILQARTLEWAAISWVTIYSLHVLLFLFGTSLLSMSSSNCCFLKVSWTCNQSFYTQLPRLWGAIFILLISGYIQVFLGTRAISRYPAPRTPFLEHLNSFNFSSFS